VADIVMTTMSGQKVTRVGAHAGTQGTMNDECVICLTRISGASGVAVLNCSHMFHLSCVYRWFQEGDSTCPCCRQEALPVEVEAEDDDNLTVISIYSSEGEDDEESIPLHELRLQVTVTDDGRSVSMATG
jgi:hypothetical protein